MSHSLCLVLVDGNPESKEDAQEIIDKALKPFSEHDKVEPYDHKCYCVGRNAQSDARDAATKAAGVENFEELREKFHKVIKSEILEKIIAELGEFSEWTSENDSPETPKQEKARTAFQKASAEAWQKYISVYIEAEKTAFEAHPDKDKPDPECGFYIGERKDFWPEDAKASDPYEDADEQGCCLGTGTYKSTYNPKSKWDWYSIGGRWNGYLDEYDVRSDPRNFERCICCGGTGDRDGWVMYRRKADAPELPEKLVAAQRKELMLLNSENFHSICFAGMIIKDEYDREFSGEYGRSGIPMLPGDEDKPDTRTEDEQVEDARKWAEKMNGCNGCKGTGKQLKFASRTVYQTSNVRPVVELPLDDPEAFAKIRPFAILSADGTWHERGDMGWWGMVGDEKEDEDWTRIALEALKNDIDKTVIVCDIHI